NPSPLLTSRAGSSRRHPLTGWRGREPGSHRCLRVMAMADDNHDEDDGSEELVLTVELEGSETTGVPYRRWTELPALEPGAYRLTRSSATAGGVGVFRVREDGSRPAAAGGWTVVSREEPGLEPGAQVLGITGFGDGFVAAGRILPQPGQGSAMPLAV